MTNKSRFLGRVGVLLLGSAALVALLTPGLANGFGESRYVLMRMQQRLVELGYTPGTPDGVFGPGTSAAFSLYQAVESLPQTGVADSATILRLLIEQQTAAQ
jgi:peptidoglycan hydrolase-like protein with peptidoglycan-binding domain